MDDGENCIIAEREKCPNRLFLAHNIHRDEPLVSQTRWGMSYLRGPGTNSEVAQLEAGRKAVVSAQSYNEVF